ncbi:hypothetical protein [Bradyrhizobium erythrophlei]|uniref:hypothetical protein n=1 Tax=Bradyrhizobium erythrophlei TaxID=1437360 RepID=UPI00115FD62C|nr:hypothetical protein [Bradyrhizobium erythrophlei]
MQQAHRFNPTRFLDGLPSQNSDALKLLLQIPVAWAGIWGEKSPKHASKDLLTLDANPQYPYIPLVIDIPWDVARNITPVF